MQLPDDRELIRSLNSPVCPACGGKKGRGNTLCSRDYFRLTYPLRAELYNRVGQGYAEAVADALAHLEVAEFKLPPPPTME